VFDGCKDVLSLPMVVEGANMGFTDFLISIVSNECKDVTSLFVVVEGAMVVSTPDGKISGMALVCCGSILCKVVILLDNL